MSVMRNLLNIIIVICVYLNWSCTVGAQERENGKVDYQTTQLSSLSPSSSSCVLSSKGSNTKWSLCVEHKHGTCSPLRRGKAARLDLDDILRRDQARLDYIRSKLSNNVADRLRQTESRDILVKDESKSKSKSELH